MLHDRGRIGGRSSESITRRISMSWKMGALAQHEDNITAVIVEVVIGASECCVR